MAANFNSLRDFEQLPTRKRCTYSKPMRLRPSESLIYESKFTYSAHVYCFFNSCKEKTPFIIGVNRILGPILR
jgi:hypothetical protein